MSRIPARCATLLTLVACLAATPGAAAAAPPPPPDARGMPSTEVVRIDLGMSPHDIVVSPPTGQVYVTVEWADGPVLVVSPATNQVVATIPIRRGNTNPTMTVNPVTGTVYVASDNWDAPGTLSVIDPATNTVTATATIGVMPTGIAVNPANGKLYIADDDSKLRVVDPRTLATLADVDLGRPGDANVAVNPENGKVYVAKPQTSSEKAIVRIVDSATDKLIATAPAPPDPTGVTINPGNGQAFVASTEAVSAIARDANRELTRVPVPFEWARGIAANPVWNQVYVGGRGGVTFLDPDSHTIIGTLSLPAAKVIRPIAVNVDRIYAGATANGDLYVITLLNPEE
jgi:YVTN family beta-propeller protein